MRWCRFNGGRWGVVRDDDVYDLTELVRDTIGATGVITREPPGDPVIVALPELTKLVRGADLGAPAVAAGDARFDSPVRAPGKIIGAPVNYQAHLDEAEADREINFGRAVQRIERAGLFLKAASSLVGPAAGITLGPFADRRTDHEVEIGVVVGSTASRVPRAEALRYVAGYTLALDVTLRGSEDRSFRKSLDSYSVLGPWLVTADEVADPADIDFSLRVNGEPRQASNTSHLVRDIPELISWASHWYTLHPCDVIMTGTPEGVGPLADGDVVDAEWAGEMRMRVAVRREA